jgi:pimeloyl-ACP methyl ester carboxylesterase
MRPARVGQAKSLNIAMAKSNPDALRSVPIEYVQSPLGHRLAYRDHGDKNARPLLCIHGLTGNGSDFDGLAFTPSLQKYRIISLDLAGRGNSDFLDDSSLYNYETYKTDILALLNHLNLNTPCGVDFLGVSLGGLLGIWLAAEPDTPIRRMVINDVGPSVPQAALDFIATVISQRYDFESLDDLEQRMRETRGLSWGPMSDDGWAHMAHHNHRIMDDGKVTYAYDPAIADIFKTQPVGAADLWPCWENLKQPILLLHGLKSMILTPPIVVKMLSLKPDMAVYTFKDCGHVPSLTTPSQIEVIRDWLYNMPS